eukprot:1190260-Amorphochlora_amoeboformis.AAC.1
MSELNADLNADTDRPVPHVGVLSLNYRVVVEIDHLGRKRYDFNILIRPGFIVTNCLLPHRVKTNKSHLVEVAAYHTRDLHQLFEVKSTLFLVDKLGESDRGQVADRALVLACIPAYVNGGMRKSISVSYTHLTLPTKRIV